MIRLLVCEGDRESFSDCSEDHLEERIPLSEAA